MDQSSPSEAPGPSWEMEGSSFINRMSTDDETTQRIPSAPIFQCFKQNKVMISNAIKKPFPFLEILRDNDLITEKMYEDFKDSCANLVPVQNVVYRALEELEKKFDLKVLLVLFSLGNLNEYPDLKPISESKDFKNVLPQLCFGEIDRGDPNLQPSLEQGPRIPIPNNMDISRPMLPVTCGTAEGTLYVENYKKGIHEKSIQIANGQWLTLKEFEISGHRERSRNWRQSIRCCGCTLGELIKAGHLPDSPRTRRQRENQTSPE